MNNPLITYLVKSNILSEKEKKEPVSPNSEKVKKAYSKKMSQDVTQSKWSHTDQKVQLQIENRDDGSPS